MKRIMVLVLTVCLLVGCAVKKNDPQIIDTIQTGFTTYYEMSDGTWQKDGNTYKYRLVISGRMPNAAIDSTFVYLSNQKTITFTQAWKATGLSSRMEDYFSTEQAVLVDWK